MGGQDIMQKLFNDSADIVEQSISGFVKCNEKTVSRTTCAHTLKYKHAPVAGKVAIVSGGGFGHEPAFMGYLGKGMLDAVAIGELFLPPTAEAFYNAFIEVDSGNGVVCVLGNYEKDIKSATTAQEMVREKGIDVRLVVVSEDVGHSDVSKRIGSTGEVFAWKIAGAAAEKGYDIDAVQKIVEKAAVSMRSIGVGLSSCIIPEVGRPNYIIERGTMEIGVGHHGQSSMDTLKLRPAKDVAKLMVSHMQLDMPILAGTEVAVMVSGLGNTMLTELNILFSSVYDLLTNSNITISRSMVGNFFTSLDMMGATLTILKLDDELKDLINHPGYPVSLVGFAQEL